VDELTEKVKNFSPEAVGSGKFWFSHTLPSTDWMICVGQALNTEEYPELFAILGYQWGGVGSSFNLPYMPGNTAVGYKEGDPDFGNLGKTGGEKAHTLTIEEMPAHVHPPKTTDISSSFVQAQGTAKVGTGKPVYSFLQNFWATNSHFFPNQNAVLLPPFMFRRK
jgi:microcystin-dependent protein